ncbi:MAG: hypothetical protein ABF460_08135 [Oenococcus sp.]|uniref:hypothetical protein n=1 Tax=Oenococcus sp. TaxID=1979414 RepID=UPI0039EAEA91
MQYLANGMVDGNLQYVNMKKRYSNSGENQLLMTSGFNWARPNFIDSSIGKLLRQNGVNFGIEKYRNGWKYLAIDANNIAHEKSLMIVKRAFISRQNNTATIESSQSNTFEEMAKINRSLTNDAADQQSAFDFGKESVAFANDFESDGQTSSDPILEEGFKRFYVLCYSLNTDMEIEKAFVSIPVISEDGASVDHLENIQDLTMLVNQNQLSSFTESQKQAAKKDESERPGTKQYKLLDEHKNKNEKGNTSSSDQD